MKTLVIAKSGLVFYYTQSDWWERALNFEPSQYLSIYSRLI